MNTLSGRWALVTGASRGIGRRIAGGLAGEGCNVIIHARTIAHLEETLRLLKGHKVEQVTVSGDLATDTGVKAVIDGVKEKPGRVDILYNNAAVQNEWRSIWEIPKEVWEETFQINLHALVALCNAFVPGMIERGFGRVVNVTSGIRDVPHLAPYGVSKAAVDKYTQDLAAELRDTGVLVNTLDPGWLKTDMGGPGADHEVDTVLPGALVPALLEDDGPRGRRYSVQDRKWN